MWKTIFTMRMLLAMRKMDCCKSNILPGTWTPRHMYSSQKQDLREEIKHLREEIKHLREEMKQKTHNMEQKIKKQAERIKEQDHILQILYVGELASSVKLFIRLKILNKRKNNEKMTSLIQFNEMVDKQSHFLTEDEIKRWREFREKLQRHNIEINELNEMLQKASEWRNTVAHPKDLPV